MIGKPLQLGLAGLGTVGTGVYETLCRNHELLEAYSEVDTSAEVVKVQNDFLQDHEKDDD
jgi:homoserine dehydrogenase